MRKKRLKKNKKEEGIEGSVRDIGVYILKNIGETGNRRLYDYNI